MSPKVENNIHKVNTGLLSIVTVLIAVIGFFLQQTWVDMSSTKDSVESTKEHVKVLSDSVASFKQEFRYHLRDCNDYRERIVKLENNDSKQDTRLYVLELKNNIKPNSYGN